MVCHPGLIRSSTSQWLDFTVFEQFIVHLLHVFVGKFISSHVHVPWICLLPAFFGWTRSDDLYASWALLFLSCGGDVSVIVSFLLLTCLKNSLSLFYLIITTSADWAISAIYTNEFGLIDTRYFWNLVSMFQTHMSYLIMGFISWHWSVIACHRSKYSFTGSLGFCRSSKGALAITLAISIWNWDSMAIYGSENVKMEPFGSPSNHLNANPSKVLANNMFFCA